MSASPEKAADEAAVPVAPESRESPDAGDPIELAGVHRRHRLDRKSFVAGLCLALAINGGGMGLLFFINRHGDQSVRKEKETYVNAQLVRFGKKRDLSFLPHVQTQQKTVDKPKVIKVADDPDKPAPKERKEEPKRTEELSKLADRVKNLRADEDDRATREALEEGDPNGVRGGTAAEASGDPYILAIMAAVVERWSVPTMLTPGELSKLQAAACLKIDEEGRLVEFKITEPSGNSLFDGSLLATLGSIKELPKPHGKFARAAKTGKLCPFFAKQ